MDYQDRVPIPDELDSLTKTLQAKSNPGSQSEV